MIPARASALRRTHARAELIPGLLKRMSIDPALAGGVVLTTVTDVIGILAFIGLATFLLLGN